MHQHTPRKTVHAAKANAKSGKPEIRSVPSVEKVSQHHGQVECEEGRKRKQRTKLNGLKATTEMTMIKKMKRNRTTISWFYVKGISNYTFPDCLQSTLLFNAGFTFLKRGRGAIPVITETQIKLPEKYKRQTFSAPLGTRCQPEREITVVLGCLRPEINALRSSETSENIRRPVVASEKSWIFRNNAVRDNVKRAIVKTGLLSQLSRSTRVSVSRCAGMHYTPTCKTHPSWAPNSLLGIS